MNYVIFEYCPPCDERRLRGLWSRLWTIGSAYFEYSWVPILIADRLKSKTERRTRRTRNLSASAHALTKFGILAALLNLLTKIGTDFER